MQLLINSAETKTSRFDWLSYTLQFHIAVPTGDALVGNLGTRELFNYMQSGIPSTFASGRKWPHSPARC
jgi:class 3 adenylate cyclase